MARRWECNDVCTCGAHTQNEDKYLNARTKSGNRFKSYSDTCRTPSNASWHKYFEHRISNEQSVASKTRLL